MRLFSRRAKPPVDVLQTLRNKFPDARRADLDTILAVRPLTMTSDERILAMCQAVRYLVDHQIPGDLVECGVWRGGSILAGMRTLCESNDFVRQIWLYDTFGGMTEPTARDVDHWGYTAHELLQNARPEDPASVWCRSPLDEVKANLSHCRYPQEQIRFVVGPVETTLRQSIPDQIALLRLDTDWYESTRIELEVLFPRLVPGGVLLIDDYGHWQGCRRAVDEFLNKLPAPMFLHRIDYTGRIGIRVAA